MPEEHSPSQQRRLVVFVHGFGSSAKCWAKLFELLKGDPAVVSALDLVCFEYPTKWFNVWVIQRIPRLQEVAGFLAEFLGRSSFAAYDDITLVGHSQGGLVIQTYLAKTLQDARGEELERIRQVILVATPNLGSTLLGPARSVFFSFFENPQERALRVLNDDIHDVLQVITERVSNARRRDNTQWPIPVRCFWGLQDRIVLEASARGPHTEGSGLPGDHFIILKPINREDQRYQAISEALLEPIGHKNFYEVDLYEQEIQVKPLPENFQEEVTFGSEAKKRLVACDNLARVVREVTFSRRNRCSDVYPLPYRTRNQGFIRARISHLNEADARELGRYDEYGTEYVFKFTPKPGEKYTLELDVYKGFDVGNRDIHIHLGKQTRCRRCRVRLDLSPYVKAGFEVSLLPELYFYPQDTGTCDPSRNRSLEDPLPYASTDGLGVWEWEVLDVWEGGVSVRWDVAKAGVPVARAAP